MNRPAPLNPTRSAPWMLISVLAHLLLLGVLWQVVAPPAEPIESRQQDQLGKLSREKLGEAADKLRAINHTELEQNLERIKHLQEELEQLQSEQAQQLAEQFADRAQQARQQALALAQQVIAEQERLLEAQSQAAHRLQTAGEALMELASAPADRSRLALFREDGRGFEALEKLSGAGREVDDARAAIERIQKLQVALADELAWLGDAAAADVQALALRAQEHATGRNNNTRDRLAWLRRDRNVVRPRVSDFFAVVDTDRMREHIQRYAHGSITNLLRHPPEINRLHEEAVEAQQRALDAQRAALDALREAPEPEAIQKQDFLADPDEVARHTDPDQTESGTTADTPAPSITHDAKSAATSDLAQTQSSNLSDLYQAAVAIEQAMGQRHNQVRAAAIVKASGVSPAAARRMVEVETPQRPALDPHTLDGPVDSGPAYQRYQEQLATAVNTSRSIVHSTQNMVASARAAAVNAESAPFDDASAGDPAASDADGHAADDAGDHAAANAEASPETSARHGLDAEFNGLFAGGGPGPGDGKPSEIDLEFYRNRVMSQVRSGRVLTAEPDALWTFINGWYMIGPFTTGRSADMQRAYTPETVIDLDATYTGPDGRALAWAYRKEAEPGTMYFPVQSGNSVYYAFTHLKSEDEMGVLLALASDDASRLWINDQPIDPPGWHETDGERPWLFSFGHDIPGYACHLHYRAYRQARLKRGVNSLLIRVENGPGGTGFALYVKPVASSN